MNFNEFIFSDRLRSKLDFLMQNPSKIPNVLCFYGQPGIGKTSFANSIADAHGATKDDFDMSNRPPRDTFFRELEELCMTRSVFSYEKNCRFNRAIILDEFHDLTERTQDKFKVFVEKFDDCLFLLCLNTRSDHGIDSALTPAMRSRTHLIDFNIHLDELEEVATKVVKRYPQLSYEEIVAYLPDMRRITREAMLLAA